MADATALGKAARNAGRYDGEVETDGGESHTGPCPIPTDGQKKSAIGRRRPMALESVARRQTSKPPSPPPSSPPNPPSSTS